MPPAEGLAGAGGAGGLRRAGARRVRRLGPRHRRLDAVREPRRQHGHHRHPAHSTGHGLAPTAPLHAGGRQAGYTRLAVAGSGAAVVSWGETDGKDWVVEASARDPGSETWGRPTKALLGGRDRIRVVPGGGRPRRRRRRLHTRRRGVLGARLDVLPVRRAAAGRHTQNRSAPERYSIGTKTAIRPDGEAIAVWVEGGDGRWSARSPVSGSVVARPAVFPGLGTPDALTTDSARLHPCHLAVGERQPGDGAAGCVRSGLAGAVHGPDAASHPRVLSRRLRRLRRTRGGGGTNRRHVLCRQHDAAAGATEWTAPTVLAGLAGSVWGTRYAIGTTGDVYAAYEAPNGTALEVAALDSAAPLLPRPTNRPRRPAAGVLGHCLRLLGRNAALELRRRPQRLRRNCDARLSEDRPLPGRRHGDRSAGHATTARATVAIAPRRPRR